MGEVQWSGMEVYPWWLRVVGCGLPPSHHAGLAEMNVCLPVVEKMLCIPLNWDLHPLSEKSSSGPLQKAQGRAESGLK